GGVLLWLRYAPLPRWLRVLLPASYYIVYEYGVISRSYTLGVLLTFAFCAFYHPRRVRFLPLAGILTLLAATSMYGTLMAISLAAFLAQHAIRIVQPDSSDDRTRVTLSLEFCLALLLFAAGLGLVALTTWPPADVRFVPAGASALGAGTLR